MTVTESPVPLQHGRHGAVHSPARALGIALVPPLTLLITFLWAFVAAFHQPQPHDLPLAIVAPVPQSAAITQGLSSHAPGAFHVERYATASEARAAVRRDELSGALIVRGRSARVLVAGAGGEAAKMTVVSALSALAQGARLRLAVDDLRPLPSHDPMGLSSFFVVFGVVIASVIFGALLYLGRSALTLSMRLTALGIYVVLAGLFTALVVDPLLGALTDHFWQIAVLTGLLALAAASAVGALGSLFRLPGIGLAVLLLVILGNSASGGPVPYRFLPDGFRQISQYLPSGAAVTALRHAVYFDGQEMAGSVLVLLCWAAVGLIVLTTMGRLNARSRDRGPDQGDGILSGRRETAG